jgi:hypothetical protein
MDEYGVRIMNIFYNRAAGKSFCLLEASSREAVEDIMKNMELNVLG